jgi:hypothetical protein
MDAFVEGWPDGLPGIGTAGHAGSGHPADEEAMIWKWREERVRAKRGSSLD